MSALCDPAAGTVARESMLWAALLPLLRPTWLHIQRGARLCARRCSASTRLEGHGTPMAQRSRLRRQPPGPGFACREGNALSPECPRFGGARPMGCTCMPPRGGGGGWAGGGGGGLTTDSLRRIRGWLSFRCPSHHSQRSTTHEHTMAASMRSLAAKVGLVCGVGGWGWAKWGGASCVRPSRRLPRARLQRC